jgi:hypothetical protein
LSHRAGFSTTRDLDAARGRRNHDEPHRGNLQSATFPLPFDLECLQELINQADPNNMQPAASYVSGSDHVSNIQVWSWAR